MKKKSIALLLAAVMVGSLFAGCGDSGANTNETNPPSVESSEPNPGESADPNPAQPSTGDAAYTFALNTFGGGAYPLDEIVIHDKRFAAIVGSSCDLVDNQFTADVVVSQLDGQLANKPDAVIPQLMAATTFEPVISKCIDAGVVFAFDSNFPDETRQETCLAYEKFAGGVSSNPYNMGVQMAELAFEDGNRTAIILGAAVGDYSHDNRIAGFTDKFEELGGKVLQVQHCTDPSEAVTKALDLVTAQPDADCMYCSGGDYLAGACSVKQQQQLNFKLYGTDVNPEYLDETAEGIVSGVNGGQGVCGSIAMTLALNLMDGHKIVDENGNAPLFDNLQVFVTTPENAEAFQKLYADNTKLITDEEYKNLCYRYNPDVTIDTYNEFLSHFGDTVLARIGG